MKALLVIDLKSLDVNCSDGVGAAAQRVGNTLVVQLSEKRLAAAAGTKPGFTEISAAFRAVVKKMSGKDRANLMRAAKVPMHTLSEIGSAKRMKADNYKALCSVLGIKDCQKSDQKGEA